MPNRLRTKLLLFDLEKRYDWRHLLEWSLTGRSCGANGAHYFDLEKPRFWTILFKTSFPNITHLLHNEKGVVLYSETQQIRVIQFFPEQIYHLWTSSARNSKIHWLKNTRRWDWKRKSISKAKHQETICWLRFIAGNKPQMTQELHRWEVFPKRKEDSERSVDLSSSPESLRELASRCFGWHQSDFFSI